MQMWLLFLWGNNNFVSVIVIEIVILIVIVIEIVIVITMCGYGADIVCGYLIITLL